MTPNKDNNFITNLQEKLSSISMTTDEKRSIRRQLKQKISETTLSEEVSAEPSSWTGWIRRLPYFFGKTAVGFAAMLFLVGGLTYAAEGSLPGSPLYTVKKNVNEAFISVTSISNSKQAATQSQLAARRINELQALVNNGKLTTTTSQELLKDIAAHTKMARQNIADLESAGERKRRQAAELRSQLTALLAAESESLGSVVSATSSATSTKNKLAQEAAQKLIAIAKEDPDFTVPTDGEALTQSALTNLFQIAVNRLENAYRQYQKQHDTGQTPPPQELVASAHDLETALKQIRKGNYESSVTQLRSLLSQLDNLEEGTVANSAVIATSSGASSTTEKSTVSSSASTATGTESKPVATTSKASEVAPSVPSKQNLHNQTIRETIAEARSYLDAADEPADEKSQGEETSSDSVKKRSTEDSAATSTANSPTLTQLDTQTSTSSGSQLGDETRL